MDCWLWFVWTVSLWLQLWEIIISYHCLNLLWHFFDILLKIWLRGLREGRAVADWLWSNLKLNSEAGGVINHKVRCLKRSTGLGEDEHRLSLSLCLMQVYETNPTKQRQEQETEGSFKCCTQSNLSEYTNPTPLHKQTCLWAWLCALLIHL